MDTLYLQELKYWSTMSFFDGYPPDNDAQLSSPVYTTRGVTIDNNNNLANENNNLAVRLAENLNLLFYTFPSQCQIYLPVKA